ncbi:DUF4397 domain-containing protein [Sphingobacterium gobiense]|uniref:DUF4397 domain-containing protein n=1 Tax=Sphingobacterium gobiense TaxID=1382456 RepID=A0A2S9JUP6_9SPHI|nr:DUF4397 domain-containing protein [Sphingobacterium gobiense]PRD56978.1 hypothetical protein C5749_07155 [Sphingobacterium gobiense]
MKKLSLQFCFLLLISLFTFSSCLKDNDDGPWNDMPAAGVMYFVNSFPDATSGLLYQLDGNTISNPLNGVPMVLEYQKFSGAQLLHPGNRKLTIRNYNNGQDVLADTTLTIKVDSGYTSFVYGTAEQPIFALAQDKVVENLGENESGIRFLNLANGVGAVNLLIEGEDEPLYNNRPIETGSSVVAHQAFQAQTSGTYTLKVTDASGNVLATREGRELKRSELVNGQRYHAYYTIMLIGKAGDENTPLYIGVVEHR